ncbi:MAG: ABC transporter ATP-binding protein [Rhodospirillales bacterium]|nr:ABC transporter ATP-binding protein [Rhodospirillales bacterium]
MPPDALNGELEPTIYRFILRHSWRDQIVVLGVTAASLPFYYYSLDLPKTIVNEAILGKEFPQKWWFGLVLDQIPYLMALCGLFLALVFINGGFKYAINVLQNRTGERMLRRLRFSLYSRLIRFPLGHFKKVSSGEIIPMITSEVEPLGGFIGESFALPAFQGGQLLTLLSFMFIQDPVLGAAAVAFYPLQGYVIPRLQRKVNQLGKRRVRTVRVLADRVNESTAGICEIRTNDAARWQMAQIAKILGTIYDIRYEIFQRKFFIKFLNNFINQLTPFFFYSIGGYLVITGELSAGALVAVLAAYKDLASPWKELLDFYQRKEDSRIKYDQIIEQFAPDGMLEARLQLGEGEASLVGELAATNLTLVEDEQDRVVDGVTFSVPAGTHVAVIGTSGSGKIELAMLLARLVAPSNGRVTVGGADLATMPLGIIGRRIGYAGATPHLFAVSLRENLWYGLKSKPVRDTATTEDGVRRRQARLAEARRAGNIDLDPDADWVDYAAAGVANEAELIERTVEVLRVVDLEEDVYALGLRGRLDPERQAKAAEGLLHARFALAERLKAEKITHLVEPFDPERYNQNASVAENLLFGTPMSPAFEFDALPSNAYFLEVLDKAGLREDLINMGAQVAETMIELFAGLPPEHEFFEQFSFISANDLPEYQAILGRIAKSGRDSLREEDRRRLLALPLKLIATRHRLGLIDEAMQQRIVEARRIFARDLPDYARNQIAFFDIGSYNPAATLQDNLLFGKIAYGEAEAATRIPALIAEVVKGLELRHIVVAVGLDFNVGTGGGRLSMAQRQKAALARALLKRPDLLILNEAASALDGTAQVKVVRGIRRLCEGKTVVWVLQRAGLARNFDHVLVMSDGRIVEKGPPGELERSGTLYKTLVAAE